MAEALGTGPSWETWNPSGWLVALSQAPFDLARRSFIGSIHPIFLLFYSKLMSGPLSPALRPVSPGGHFSKDWAYHSLSQSFVADALQATSSGLGSWWEGGGGGEGAELDVQILLKQQMNQKKDQKNKKMPG